MDKLKQTPEMSRIIKREKMLKDRGIPLEGAIVAFSDVFVEAIKKVPGAEIDKMEFYVCFLRPEQVKPQMILEFDYFGDARKIDEIKQWHEILPVISCLICGPYTLQYYGSNFNPIEGGGKKIKIKYDVSENPKSAKKEEIIKPISPTGRIVKEGEKPKKQGGKKCPEY